MTEWRDVKGYEGFYQVSDDGRVRGLTRTEHSDIWKARTRRGRVLHPALSRYGYPKVNLYRDGKCRTFLVHRLVAIAFIPNPSNKPEVNHKNGIRSDSRLENLEWVTSAENIRHTFDVLGRVPAHNGRFSAEQIRAMRASNETQRQIAKRYGISRSMVGQIKTRKAYKEIG